MVPDEQFNHLVRQIDATRRLAGQPARSSASWRSWATCTSARRRMSKKRIVQNLQDNPSHRYLLLRMLSVAQIDISGIHMLESIVRTYREQGGDVFMVRVQPPVSRIHAVYGICRALGAGPLPGRRHGHQPPFLQRARPSDLHLRMRRAGVQGVPESAQADAAAWCCHPHGHPARPIVPAVKPQILWAQLRSDRPPLVVDVREPREFWQAHVPQAQLVPLLQMLTEPPSLPHDRPVILACRSGRRSERAAARSAQPGL